MADTDDIQGVEEEKTDMSLLYGDNAEDGGETEQLIEDVPAENAVEENAKEEIEEKKRDHQVPRARFDGLHAKYESLAEEHARITAELEGLKTSKVEKQEEKHEDLKKLNIEYAEAIADLDYEKASEIQERRDAVLLRKAEESFEQKMTQRERKKEENIAQETLNDTANKIAEKYPALDSRSDDRDDTAIQDVLEMRDFFIFKGQKPHVALERAVEMVMKDRQALQKESVVEKQIDTRKEKALVRNIKDSASQPPTLRGVGARENQTPLLPDNQDDYDRLPMQERKSALL